MSQTQPGKAEAVPLDSQGLQGVSSSHERLGEQPSQRSPSAHASTVLLQSLLVPVVIPVFFLFAATLIFVTTSGVDIAIAQCFYNAENGSWLYANTPLCRFLYEYGPLPGIMLGLGGLLVGLMSFRVERLRAYRKPAFFLGVMLILGPGLVVNTLVKPNWGRPRPKETTVFGGNKEFLKPWQMGDSAKNKSFPSGHASTGFMLMAPAFLLYRRRRKLAYAFVALGLAAGGAIGLTRMVQGAHYTSDVLWAGGLVYLTGLLLHAAFYFDEYPGLRRRDAGPATSDAELQAPSQPAAAEERHAA